jgi:hypothetical protein
VAALYVVALGKRETHALATNRLAEEVNISREKCASMRRSAVEKLGIIQPAGAGRVGGEDVTRRSHRPSVLARGTWTSINRHVMT